MRGTLSQPAIGRTTRSGDGRHNVGFWYRAYRDRVAALVSLPTLDADAGERVVIPLTLERSQYLRDAGATRFRAKIRYNGSLLQPEELDPQCRVDTTLCTISLDGDLRDTSGLLAAIPFRAKLGNADSTALVIEEFAWETERPVLTLLRDGTFLLADICRTGGRSRLLLSGAAAKIVGVYPNPASTTTTISLTTSEGGSARITLVNIAGVEVAELYSGPIEPGSYSLNVDLGEVSSGEYRVVVQTASATLSEPLLVQQ